MEKQKIKTKLDKINDKRKLLNKINNFTNQLKQENEIKIHNHNQVLLKMIHDYDFNIKMILQINQTFNLMQENHTVSNFYYNLWYKLFYNDMSFNGNNIELFIPSAQRIYNYFNSEEFQQSEYYSSYVGFIKSSPIIHKAISEKEKINYLFYNFDY